MKWTSDIVLDEGKLKSLLIDHITSNAPKFGFNPKTDTIKSIRTSTMSDPTDTGFGHTRQIFDSVTVTVERITGEYES